MWADQFVGLPYKIMGRDRKGLDCYGLVRLVLKEMAKQDWPSYCDEDPDGSTIVQLVSNNEAHNLINGTILRCGYHFDACKRKR